MTSDTVALRDAFFAILLRQPLEKAQNRNGQALQRVGMDLRLAPHPHGVGASILGP